jgi:hypothetical protein
MTNSHIVIFLLTIVLSVLLLTASITNPMFCFLFNVLLIIVCHIVIFLLSIVLSVLLLLTSSITNQMFCFLCNVLLIIVCHIVIFLTIWQTMINITLHRKQNIWLVIEAVSRRRTANTMVKRKITIWHCPSSTYSFYH